MEKQRNVSAEENAFRIRLADRVIDVRPIHDGVRYLCRDYIVPADGTPADFAVQVTEEDLAWEDRTAREQADRTGDWVNIAPAYLETLTVYRKIASAMPVYDTFLMHGSVISTAGQGYMICAPSGVGKTTRTKLWVDGIPDSFIVNGDKPLVRVTAEGVTAFGTPWCGKEGWNANCSVPLRAVYLLERGENEISEISFADAFPALLRQTFMPRDPEERRQVLRLLTNLSGKVRIFRFRSRPDMAAVQMAWEAAGGRHGQL